MDYNKLFALVTILVLHRMSLDYIILLMGYPEPLFDEDEDEDEDSDGEFEPVTEETEAIFDEIQKNFPKSPAKDFPKFSDL